MHPRVQGPGLVAGRSARHTAPLTDRPSTAHVARPGGQSSRLTRGEEEGGEGEGEGEVGGRERGGGWGG